MVLLVCLVGGVGAVTRFITDGVVRSKVGRRFPWGTLLINLTGALLLGTVTALSLHHHITANEKVIFGTGFCGGYTTFSTASFETVRLIEEKRFAEALFHSLTNLCVSVGLAAMALAWA
ncbi:MAG TPA: fluoride efflux transporter CrcB [Candidatus Saccharimonadales bacterium]